MWKTNVSNLGDELSMGTRVRRSPLCFLPMLVCGCAVFFGGAKHALAQEVQKPAVEARVKKPSKAERERAKEGRKAVVVAGK